MDRKCRVIDNRDKNISYMQSSFPNSFILLLLLTALVCTVGGTKNVIASNETGGGYVIAAFGYSDIDDCDDDDDDALPKNFIEETYANGRMAFLFGQYKVAYNAWKPLADDGYAKAQAALAWIYHTGNGVEKNIKKAIEWYRLAAHQGHPIAQNNLGVMFENGTDVPKNNRAAISWYRDAAKSGYSYAQFNLGRMYAEGIGLKLDLEQARYWFHVASRQGVRQAAEALTLLDNQAFPPEEPSPATSAVAHAPHHSDPVTNGLGWLNEQPVNYYTIQLARSQDLEWVLKLATSEKLDQPIIHFESKDAKNVTWHNLIFGSFSSFTLANGRRKTLPASLRAWSPRLQRFGEIQQLIKKKSK